MLEEAKIEEAKLFDVWEILAVWYSLRSLGLCVEFYNLASNDPTYAKLVLPAMEHRG